MSEFDEFPTAVLGAGTMGHGIALVLALAGHPVRLMDTHEAVLANALDHARTEAEQLVEHGLVSAAALPAALARIETGTDLATAVAGTTLVVEAITERVEPKQRLFNELERLCGPETVLASNSSAIPISEIACEMERPERAIGWHWFAPPHLVPLVEVVQGQCTAEAIVQWLRGFTGRIGKIPIVVRKDLPGFAVNRLQHALMREVFHLLDAGIASAQDLDRAVRYSFGVRLMASGPLEQRDHAGLDVHQSAARRIYPTLSNNVAPDGRLTELVEAGALGVKTGHGFFDWSRANAIDVMRERDERLIAAVHLLRELDNREETSQVDEAQGSPMPKGPNAGPTTRSLGHIGVPVSDVERSLHFYRDLLGLEVLSSREVSGERLSAGVQVPDARVKIVLLRAGDQNLELIQYLHPIGKPFDRRNNDIGACHIAFEVVDIRTTYERLQTAGVSCNTPPFPSTYPEGWGWFYARDPDGITVEFNGPLDPEGRQ